MTVRQLLSVIDSHELTEQMVFDVMEAEAKKKAMEEARLAADAQRKLTERKLRG